MALLYYPGYGSQEPASRAFWHLESNELDETLVCFDGRSPGYRDLADKELSKLVDKVASGVADVVVILECCHSGSGKRNLDLQLTAVRQGAKRLARTATSPNTVEIIVTCCIKATSGSLSPCGRGPGRGGQGSTERLACVGDQTSITPLPTLSRKGRG
jgi:hypothetical protein